jgi:Cu(I)/Ag(I) efflux system membrane protein CusA/SilA
VEAGGRLTRASLLEGVIEGALLRLRPKVMTVTTVVASLLPIMWSISTGAEVMKPLATPVLGGMVSSLAHVLIVTPVIFYWLRERELRKEGGQETIETLSDPVGQPQAEPTRITRGNMDARKEDS